MISTADDAVIMYKILRPNGSVSQGELDATTGQRSFHNFIHDAAAEVQVRDASLAHQTEELTKMQITINELNKTITDIRTTETKDATALAEEQHAAQEKISYLTGQLEASHDKITQLQNMNVPAVAKQGAAKPNVLTAVMVGVLNAFKKK